MSRLLAHARVHTPWRRALAHRSVHRDVQGVGLWMPWSHRLPDYAALSPAYGQNLVELAALLTPSALAEPLEVIDVGANIGDSTKQILGRVRAHVLAVEGDPYYLAYLRRNVGNQQNVTIAPVLLTTASNSGLRWRPTRRGGTTQFREPALAERAADAGQNTPSSARQRTESLSVGQMAQAYPQFSNVRLIKSDTDGHDTELVPELAAVYRSARPVLFFEFDPALTTTVAGAEAGRVWAALAELGYDRVGFWTNDGVGLHDVRCTQAAEAAANLLATSGRRVAYLDVVAVHADDAVGQAALDSLFNEPTMLGA